MFNTYRWQKISTGIHAAYLLAGAIGLLLTSYYGLTYSESISAKVSDDWCEPNSEGIGVHCFSDFYQIVQLKQLENPWSTGTAYTPIPIFLMKLLGNSYFYDVNSRLPLLLNQIAIVVCTAGILVYHLMRYRAKYKSNSSRLFLLVLGLSTPVLILFDRGNSVYLLFPLVYIFCKKLLEGKIHQAAFCVGLAACIRPPMILLVISFFIFEQIKPFLISIITCTSGIALSFLLFPGNYMSNFINWLQNSFSYQTYSDIPSLRNFSFANFVGLVNGAIKFIFQDGGVSEVFRPPLSSSSVTQISILFLFICCGIIFYIRMHLTKIESVFISIVVTILTPGTSFGYYLILLLIPLLFCMITGEENANIERHKNNLLEKVWQFHFTTLYILLIPPWPFQWGLLNLSIKNVWYAYGISGTVVGILLAVIPITFFLPKVVLVKNNLNL